MEKGAAVFDEYCLPTLFESEEYTWTVGRRPMYALRARDPYTYTCLWKVN
jgi:hypothetical protein